MLQQTLRRQGVLCILNNTCVQQKELISYPKRLEFRRLIKYKSIFEQKFFDHFNRTPDQRGELTNWNERDPLYFDERHRNIRGGIDIYIADIKHKRKYNMALRHIAWILYQMAKEDYYDPEIYVSFEAEYDNLVSTSMITRYAFAGLYAYYKSSQGSLKGLTLFEDKFEASLKQDDSVIVQEIIDLTFAFLHNTQLTNKHFHAKLDRLYKPIIVAKWGKQVMSYQRRVWEIMNYLKEIEWFDEEVWNLIIKTFIKKRKINNVYFHIDFYETLIYLNDLPTFHRFQQLGEEIAKVKEMFYKYDRDWRYDPDAMRWRTYQELLDNRDKPKIEDFTLHFPIKGEVNAQDTIKLESEYARMQRENMKEFEEIVMKDILIGKLKKLDILVKYEINAALYEDIRRRHIRRKQLEGVDLTEYANENDFPS